MYISNDQFAALESALNVITPDLFKTLSKTDQEKIVNGDVALLNIYKKKKKDNARQAKYVAERRKTNPNYGR